MTENEKRAEALSWGCESVYRDTSEMQIATALDAAERRGEERVLRFARSLGEVTLAKHYRSARRARARGKR